MEVIMKISNFIFNDLPNQSNNQLPIGESIDTRQELIHCSNRLCEIRDLGLRYVEDLTQKIDRIRLLKESAQDFEVYKNELVPIAKKRSKNSCLISIAICVALTALSFFIMSKIWNLDEDNAPGIYIFLFVAYPFILPLIDLFFLRDKFYIGRKSPCGEREEWLRRNQEQLNNNNEKNTLCEEMKPLGRSLNLDFYYNEPPSFANFDVAWVSDFINLKEERLLHFRHPLQIGYVSELSIKKYWNIRWVKLKKIEEDRLSQLDKDLMEYMVNDTMQRIYDSIVAFENYKSQTTKIVKSTFNEFKTQIPQVLINLILSYNEVPEFYKKVDYDRNNQLSPRKLFSIKADLNIDIDDERKYEDHEVKEMDEAAYETPLLENNNNLED